MVGKLEMGLMALFEPIALASASFLIHFYRALTFETRFGGRFFPVFGRIHVKLEIRHRCQRFFLCKTFHCNYEHIDVFRFLATDAKKLRCHLCKEWVCSASWRSLKAPACARWCYKGVCRTLGRHLLKKGKEDE